MRKVKCTSLNYRVQYKRDEATRKSSIYVGALQNAPTQHTLKVIDYQNNQLWQRVGM